MTRSILGTLVLCASLFTLCMAPPASAQAKQPNIVLVFMDNFGWGEVGAYGGGVLRGAPTPSIDSLAEEGMKLLNFNVESQCVPSRSAIMTGRYAIRSGTSKVGFGSLWHDAMGIHHSGDAIRRRICHWHVWKVASWRLSGALPD